MGIAVTWNSNSAESIQFRLPCSDPGELCDNFCLKAACLLVIPTHKGIIFPKQLVLIVQCSSFSSAVEEKLISWLTNLCSRKDKRKREFSTS